jgi:hypothetical protein
MEHCVEWADDVRHLLDLAARPWRAPGRLIRARPSLGRLPLSETLPWSFPEHLTGKR